MDLRAASTSSPRGGESRRHTRPCCAKARERGIRVLTWDADAEADAARLLREPGHGEGSANALTDEAARLLGGAGEFAIITGALSAANQGTSDRSIRKRLAEKHS